MKVPHPEDRKPEASPSGELRGSQVAASAPAPKKSIRRPLMFALLPVALVVGGYFYVTGGAVMSTDNAYVQADMVGLSTDVAGIVTQVMVHEIKRSPRATSCSSWTLCSFSWRWIAPRLRSEIRAMISSRCSQLPQHAGPGWAGAERCRLQHGQLPAPGTTDCQQFHSGRQPTMPPATPCRGRSRSLPRRSNS